MAFQGLERRLRTRFRVRVPFVLKNDSQQVRGITRNMSLLGISAYTESPLRQVQPVQCLLEVPEIPSPLVVNGTVIRCETLPQPHPDGPYEMGVFFRDFQGSAESDLIRFLDRVAGQEQAEIEAGYRILKQRLAARRRRKRLEALRKRRRRLERLRRRRQRLAKQKRLAAQRRRKQAQRRRKGVKSGSKKTS